MNTDRWPTGSADQRPPAGIRPLLSRLVRAGWLLGTLVALALAPTVAVATHGELEIFPAWYKGKEVLVMMGPAGNSADPNQVPSACFGLGPDFSQTARAADVPAFYGLFVPGATQMSCPDGSSKHDMVLTALPGDPDYNAAVQTIICLPDASFSVADMPITSAAQVQAAIAAGKLACSPGRVLLSPVVRAP